GVADANGVIQLAESVDYTGLTIQYNLFDENATSGGDNATTIYLGGATPTYHEINISRNTFHSRGNAIFLAAPTPLSDGVISENVFDGTIGGVAHKGYATVNIGQAGNLQITGNAFQNSKGTTVQVGIIGGSITGNTF